ncbi:MAG TPA: GGDEF and EAL domain-containing protein [Candidatus Cybelea sp.]|nr:GGDEF and EAL domain-containing protein [Candidatus Cybelea sp.]
MMTLGRQAPETEGLATLLESEAVARAVGAAGDLTYHWDILNDGLQWGGNVADLLGESNLEIQSGHGFNNRIHPEDLPIRLKALSDHFAGHAHYDCEYRLRNGQGGIVWVHDRGRAVFDGEKTPVSMAGVLRVITTRKQAEARLERVANYDELTGHFNKTRLRDELDQALTFARRFYVPGAFMVVGIDKLAMINSAFGYEVGDAVLVAVGQRLDRFVRSSDVVGRLGGDRFGVILSQCREEMVVHAMDRIIDGVREEPVQIDGQSIPVSVSIGCVLFPGLVNTAYDVMAKAELALNYAKRNGRSCFNTYRVSEQQGMVHRQAMDIGAQVQQAMRDHRLLFMYQPIVTAETHEVVKYEALLRMKDDKGAIVPAGAFIPVVEQLGMARALDRYVLDMAISELRSAPDTSLAINISGLTASDQSWLRALISAVRSTPQVAPRLVVEITETAALHDIEESARFVNVVRDLGCKVAIDDFGAGFTSFRHLKALTVDMVKIDGSFVLNLSRNIDNQLFVRNLMGLAATFGLETVAEFVENAEDAEFLLKAGVQYLQGYYFGRPALKRAWATGQRIAPVPRVAE